MKRLWSLARIALSAVGFAVVFVGAYVVSLETEYEHIWRLVPAYVMIVVGLLLTFIGVFWTICSSMKIKMYPGGGREQQIQVYTVDRPSSFPPSYEDSQGSGVSSEMVVVVVVDDGVDAAMSLAPPLYSRDGTEAPDCKWSWEQPPRYSQVERVHLDAEERREASSDH